MQNLIEQVVSLLEQGRSAVLCTIVAREGSFPRGVGTCMLIVDDGQQYGTIGGGRVEYAAARHARERMHGCDSEMQTFPVSHSEGKEPGIAGGGRVTVLFQRLTPEGSLPLFNALMEARVLREETYLIRGLQDGHVVYSGGWLDEAPWGDCPVETETVLSNLGPRAVYVEGSPALLIEPIVSTARAFVFGGGHVAQRLVPLLRYLDFRVMVYEDRPEFGALERFPEAEEVLLGGFEEIPQKARLTKDDYAIVMTRGHQADYEVLRQLLRTDASYIGCIGSKLKIALNRQRLLDDGFSEEEIDRIHAPIGLPIRAETPEEIAVSVAAELIRHRAENRD